MNKGNKRTRTKPPKWLRDCVPKVLATTVLLGALIPSYSSPAYAEPDAGKQEDVKKEDDKKDKDGKETKTPEGAGKNNIFDTTNQAYVEPFKNATKYKLGMQYAVTYNILSSQYGDGSKYSGLFRGDKSAVAGSWSETFALPQGNDKLAVGKFGGKNLYDSVASGKERDGSFEDKGEGKDTGNDDSKELEKLAEPLAETISKKYASTINYYLGINDALMTMSKEISLGGSLPWSNEIAFNQRGMPTHWYGFTRPGDYASQSEEDKLQKAIKPEIVKRLTNVPKKEDVSKTIELDRTMVEQYVKTHREKLKKDTVDNKVGSVSFERAGWKVLGMGTEDRYLYTLNDSKNVSKDKAVEYLDGYTRFNIEVFGNSPKKDYNSKIGKKFKETTTEAMDKLDKTAYDKYIKALEKKVSQGKETTARTGEYSILGWSPLIVGYEKSGDITSNGSGAWFESTGGYLKAIETFDGSKMSGTSLQTKSGSPRAVRLYDMFGNKQMSPVFIYNTEQYKNKAVQVQVGKAGSYSKSSMGEFLGMKGTAEFKLSWGNLIGDLQQPAFSTAKPEKGAWYGEGIMQAITANPTDIKTKTESDDTVGIDNYGNIIVGSTGTVLIPYWQNYLFLRDGLGGKSEAFVSSPIFNNKDASKTKDALKDYLGESGNWKSLEKHAKLDGIDSSLKEKVQAVQNALPDGGQISFDKMNEFMQGKTLENNQDTIRALAMIITASTSKTVEEWNKQFLADAEKSQELYMDLGTGGFNTSGTSNDTKSNEWDAKSLIQRIGMLLDVGFYELIRLTLASWVVSVYNSSFIGYSMNAIFHTSTIADTAMWEDVIGSIALLLIGFMSVYMLFMAFKVFRRTMTAKDFVKQFVLVTLIILIPAMVYSPLIKYFINEPSNVVIGKQLRQTSLLDTWLAMEKKERTRDEMYVKLFGGTDQLRDRSQDYIVYFYTTKHRSGFDIDSVKDEELTLKDKLRKQVVNDGGTWNEKDLVKVGISIFDLFDWAEARYNKKTEDKLFNWVETNKNAKGEYKGISQYTEYHVDTSSKFGKQAETNGIKNVKGIDTTASEMYLRIVNKTKDAGVLDSLNGLYNVSKAMRDPVQGKPITDDEREALLRDLSMTQAGRHSAYGMEGNPFSPKAEKLMNENSINKPESDMLGIGALVNELAPYRDMQTKSLDRDIYDINRELLNDYMTTYSIVRDNMNNPTGSFKDAEVRMVTLSEFFKVNKVLKLHAFPTNYEGQTVSFDSYVRMAFVPMYAFDLENQDLDNVAQYLALRENPLVLFAFLFALFSLLVFGMTYLVVFYCGMMIVMTVAFFKNYVIRFNRENKSWLGALMIIGTFGLAKLGLMTLWFAMTYFMNYSTAKSQGLIYPYVLVHSLIISVYIFVVMKFVFMKVFKAVIKDKANLGGEIFSNGLRKMQGNVGGMVSGFTRGMTRGAMRGVGNTGRSLRRALASEGAKGVLGATAGLGARGLRRGKRLLGKGSKRAVGKLFGKQLSQMNIAGAKESIQQKLDDAKQNVKGKFEDSKIFQSLRHMKGATKEAFKGMAQDYYNVKADDTGLNDALKVAKNKGQVVDSGGATFTTMSLDSKEQAKKVAKHLQKQGIKASQEMSTVSFDTTGLDLENASVRKALFGEVVDSSYDELSNAPTMKEQYGLSSLNYSTLNKDGEREIEGFKVGVGRNGLTNQAFTDLVNSKYFTDNFRTLSAPEKDASGNYLPGSVNLEFIGRGNGKRAMRRLFDLDADLRSDKGLDAREQSRLTSGIDIGENSLLAEAEELMVQGMQVQNGRVLFDPKNQYHRKAMQEIEDQLKPKVDGYRGGHTDMIQKMSAYVVDGGNHGFMTQGFTPNSEGAGAVLNRLGLDGTEHYDKVYAGSKEEAVAMQETLNGLKTLTNLSGADIESYARTKDNMVNHAVQLATQSEDGTTDFEKGIASFTTYATKVGAQGEFADWDGKYRQLMEEREMNTVSDANYNTRVQEIFQGMTQSMNNSGAMEGYASEKLQRAINSPDREALSKFRELKEQLVTKNKVDAELLTRFDLANLGELESVLRDIKGVQVGKDGVLTVTSNGNGVSAQGLQNILKRYQSA
ncbi:hypothetical protein [Bacillus thuringiensis]|uniref:hypothetical protein n=1 Tax=Bacillus thuringiensis TaxID=1428 RepID=UPI000BFE98A6|nr:hypothetical protein [Bacillus thuringiensis]PGT90061.1 hypothetical protein COD17_09940 [Bacillus thuringiensis]